MTPCPLLDGLYGISYSLEATTPEIDLQVRQEMAAHLRTVAQELREVRGQLRLTLDLLNDSLANTEALLNDEPPAERAMN